LEHTRNKLTALVPAIVWLSLLLIFPLFIILVYSFLTRGVYGNIEFTFTLENYARVLDPLYLPPVLRSISMSAITTVLCGVIGFPLAYYISHQAEKRKNILLVLIMLPFWTDFLVRTYAWMFILRTEGLMNTVLGSLGIINSPIEILFTQQAVVLGLVYGYLPFMVLPLYASLEKLDQSLIAAAQDLGATPLQKFLHVTLPLTKPGVIAGSILVFIPTFGAFITPDLLGGSKQLMIGNLMKDQFLSARDWPFGSALSFIVMAVVMVLLQVYIRMSHAESASAQRSAS
jgi:spermidine/putrescine transport system permease protein